MALGTTNLALRDSLYVEMGKGTASTNYSLGQCKYGVNDIDITTYGAANPATVQMSAFASYAHKSLQFRFNPAQTLNSDTYYDTDANKFGVNGAGIPYSNQGATNNGTNWGFDGGSDWGAFLNVGSGTAYKVSPTGTGVIGFWVFPQDNSAGQTIILGNDLPFGSVTTYRGIRFDITTAMKIRVLRGDGTGIASSDRRTFESVGTLVQDVWNFVAFQHVYNSTTTGTTSNYFWIHRGTGWSNGATFLSGTGGNLAYGSTDGMTLSSSGNGGRYFQGGIGGIYAFNQSLTTTNVEDLYRSTNTLY